MATHAAGGTQLRLPYGSGASGSDAVVSVSGVPAGVVFVRRRRARHYILRLREDGVVRVTVPWGGSRAQAERFLRERRAWIVRERHRRDISAGTRRGPWRAGTIISFRGADVPLEVVSTDGHVKVAFAGELLTVPLPGASNLRQAVEEHLRRLASRELPARLDELARTHGLVVSGVSVRNQRTRWGSCSRSGRISLNWRLVQMPPAVRDYVLLHELTHLRHPNHSARFWRELARACPHHAEARRFLRTAGMLAC